MPELDPIVAKILLEGDDELIKAFEKIGVDGAEKIGKLFEATQKSGSALEALGGSLGIVEGALSAATAALIVFVEQQTELSQKTELLAEAFGTTSSQLQQVEQAFASAGVKVEQFERFANRLTVTIAREWPQIAESIKNYATENDAATLRVSSAILRVRDAQNALADNAEDRSAQMSNDNNALEASYLKLQFAAQHAAQEQISALQSVRGAQLSVLSAEQHLAELEGRPPSAAEKQSLAVAQAHQALDVARKAERDAQIAAREQAAGAALKQAQLEQAYDDIARKAAKNARDDAENRVKDENRVKEAIIARAEAEDKAEKFTLTNIKSIRDALDGVVTGQKGAATSIDLTKVSVENLTKALIAQAGESEKSGRPPKGFDTLISLRNTLTAATENQITQEQKLAIINKLAGTSMQALGASAAEISAVLQDASIDLKKFDKAAEELNTDETKNRIKSFRGALAELHLTLSILSQKFAIAISPAFTSFLKTIQESLESNTGTLKLFIDGISSLGTAISTVFGEIRKIATSATDALDKAFGLEKGRAMQILLGAIVVAVGRFASAWVGVPLVIATVVTSIGYISDHLKEVQQWIENNRTKFVIMGAAIAGIAALFAPWTVALGLIIGAVVLIYENWDKIKAKVSEVWAAVTDNAVVQWFKEFIDNLKSIYDWFGRLKQAAPKWLGGGGGAATPNPGASSDPAHAAEGPGFATGGAVDGPGTTTSDSIFARLSRGEFVIKAAAVQEYGAGLFHALNNMQMPGFASGGLVPSPVRMGGGAIAPATSTLNLSLDGRSFDGLKGPKSTIDDLSSFAVSRQTSAAGKNPSWVG
jgi:transcriptional regulator with XRE-family HTH domain